MSGGDAPLSYPVFVYGTLKRGEPNHHWLTDPTNGNSKFLGEAKTTVKYPLVIASRWNIPFLLDVPGTGNFILGEVYEVDNKTIESLDEMAAVPKEFFRRVETVLMDGKEVKSWMYFIKHPKPKLLQLPFLSNYSSIGYGLPYIPGDLRPRNTSYNYMDDVSYMDHIEGEVFEVDDKMLSSLDVLEGYPEFYTRRLEAVVMAEGERDCWMYFLNGHKPSLLQLPFLTSYSSTGSHGLVYMDRYKRDPTYNIKAEVLLHAPAMS